MEYKLHLRWSLLFIGTCFCWQVLERLAGLHNDLIHLHFKSRILFFIITTVIFFLAIKEISTRENYNNLKKRAVLTHGLILTGIIALLMPASLWILYNYITPDFIDNANEYLSSPGVKDVTHRIILSDKLLLTKIPFVFITWGIFNALIMSYVFKLSPGKEQK